MRIVVIYGLVAAAILAMMHVSTHSLDLQNTSHDLSYAVASGDLRTVNEAIARGDRCSVRDHAGRTLLMVAAICGRDCIVQRLLAANADVDAQDQEGRTALIVAASLGRGSTIRMLLLAGADPNLSDHHGNTALLSAVEAGSADVVQLLLSNGADMDAVDPLGRTALIVALEEANAAMAEQLIDAGAQIDADPEEDAATAWAADIDWLKNGPMPPGNFASAGTIPE